MRIDLTYKGVVICSLYPIKKMGVVEEIGAGQIKRDVMGLNSSLRGFRFIPNTELLKVGIPITVTDPIIAEGIIEEKIGEE